MALDFSSSNFATMHSPTFQSYEPQEKGLFYVKFVICHPQCRDQLGAFFESVQQQSSRVSTLQRALNDVASRCAELAAAKAALMKRTQAFELELSAVGANMSATKAELAVCEREREVAQDEVVRLTDIAAQQQEQMCALQAKHDAMLVELDRVRAELTADREAKSKADDALNKLTESLATERTNAERALAAEREQSAAAAAALEEAASLQNELESSLSLCISQRDRALQMLQQEQSVVAEFERLNRVTSATTTSMTTPRLSIPTRPAVKRGRVASDAFSLANVNGAGVAAPSPASQRSSVMKTKSTTTTTAAQATSRTGNQENHAETSEQSSRSSSTSSRHVVLLP